MSTPRLPFSTRIPGATHALPLPNGELAVLGSEGIVVLGQGLGVVDRIARGVASRASRFVILDDGRYLAFEPTTSELFAGTRGGTFEKIEADGRYFSHVTATSTGFVASSHQGILVEANGTRAFHAVPHTSHGVVRLSAGALSAGGGGLAWVDAAGAIRLEERSVAGPSLVLPKDESLGAAAFLDRVVLHTSEGLVLLRDGNAGPPAAITIETPTLHAFAGGVLVAGERVIAFFEVVDDTLREVWTKATALFAEGEPSAPIIVGERFVIGGVSSKSARIVDQLGDVVASVTLEESLADACAFGDGVALRAWDAERLVWWRPGEEPARLEHDAAPPLLCSLDRDTILSVDGEMVYVWRASESGPEAPPIVTQIPFGVPLVIDGTLVTVEGSGRFALKARNRHRPIALAPNAKFRRAASPEEGKQVLASLLARTTTGDLPLAAIAEENVEKAGRVLVDVRAILADLPLMETVSLQTRALFAPGKMDRRTRMVAYFGRDAFFAELAVALGMSTRVLAAGVRAGEVPLDPPKKLEGFEYLGSFTSSGTMVVADPCYIGRSKTAFALSFIIEARDGRWHAYVRPAEGEPTRTAELVVVHERGFDCIASDPIGNIGVDSGQAGVFDRLVPKPNANEPPLEEGIVGGLGAVASSGLGDGFYPAFAGSISGKIAKVRIHFLGPSASIDTTASSSKSNAEVRPYRATEKYAVGERVEHKKFGAGTVVRDLPGGKIEVLFDEGARTLVHGLT